MKLQAITICVHGADLLSCTLANRHQFDRWLIVTVPRDAETIALCRDNGIECVTTAVLRPDGVDLYEGDNLARATAEALVRLDPSGWIILLSEQLLLPRTFRAQMLAAKLDTDCEYRLAGVRPCRSRSIFERMAVLEPWRAVPTKAFDDGPPFRMFAHSANATRIDPLAVTALAVSDGCSPSSAIAMPDSRGLLVDWLACARGKTERAMVAGSCPAFDLERLGRLFKTVYVQDASDETVATNSIDVLYLPGEASPEALSPCIPLWRRVLRPDAIVCGDLYGMADWPEATSTITQLFGRPQLEQAGFWWTKVKGTPLLDTRFAARERADAIRLIVDDTPADDTLLSLYSLRWAWRGAIHVTATRPNPALQLQCALLGGEWHAAHADRRPSMTISAGTLAFGTIAQNEALTEVDADRDSGSSSHRLLQRLGLAKEQPSLVRYQGDPARWTKRNRTARFRMAADTYHALFPTISTPADSTVATIVDPSTLPAFRAEWPRWVFGATPIVVAHVGLDRSELDWLINAANARCIEIKPETAASPARALKRLVSHTATKRLVLLPAGARPMPGATLFAEADHAVVPIVLHSSAEVQPVAGVAPLPERNEPLAACMTLAVAHDICSAGVVKHKGSLAAFINRALRAGRVRWSTCNLGREGWQLKPGSPQ